MIWKFLKSNWFSVALVLLVVMAIARKNLRIDVGSPAEPRKRELTKVKTEKFTEVLAAGDAPAQLGLVPDPSQPSLALPAIGNEIAIAYLRRFSTVAVGEHKKFGMPASVLLAYSYVNSFAGQRLTAQQANNYFALDCAKNREAQMVTINGRCFRRYDTAWDSFRDFSNFLSAADWYAEARKACGQDWRKWLEVLQAHHLSDVEHSKAEMEKVIQQYRLFELDDR